MTKINEVLEDIEAAAVSALELGDVEMFVGLKRLSIIKGDHSNG
jgi:hypothetical protein